ncbi:HD-GYP domain-containing protein [Pseudodesulfovibrio piezophilus]|uniref:Metal dependent phosphohydrolase n=1 Tax=Pseudodesulfovibrio piezophilus (strain DSM 21447 / JCM 15486 / C1TLV30) TaxID=1322246 RepID=M1WPC2_PSEP2|nr:HD domain-containing phosphohydrolase [Pseudodesulfovibrio piezophilus]CCH48239.1 Metal dependent phosphohydrolase [Pseudodesulfovibrio piezophilus C1TLV30]
MAQSNNAEYVPISPLVLRPDTKGQFDIFLRRGTNYVLFNANSLVITRDKIQELAHNENPHLYIDRQGLDHYKRYIQENIADLLDDDSVAPEERAKAWAGTATQLGKELFEKSLPGRTFERRFQRFTKLIENSSRFLQSPKSLKELSRFISKGYEAYHHGISTMVYTVSLMQEYDYDDAKILACGMGAMLHDIGKTGLPKEVVESPHEDLTDEQKELFVLHPMIGARTCSAFNLPTAASNCILFHHEREDGTGYPTKAKGSELPIHTKILALCNVYDNLTRTTRHDKALTPFNALKRIMDDEGLVDKSILKKFVEMLSRAEIV